MNGNKLLWTDSSAWTLNNSGGFGIDLYDNGGLQAKIENESTGLVTINAPIVFAATTGTPWAEINAVNGDITFGSAATLGISGSAAAGLEFYGNNRTVTLGGIIYVGNGGNTFGNTNSGVLLSTAGVSISRNIVTNKADNGGSAGSGTRTIGGSNTTGTTTFSGSIFLNGGAVLTSVTGGTAAFTGVIQNGTDTGVVSRAVTVSGLGTITFSNVNTYTGATSINGGKLQINNGGSTASGSAVAVNATGAGALTINSGGTVGGNVTVAPSVNVTTSNLVNNGTISGTLTINSSSTPAPITVQANAVISGNANLGSGSSTGNVKNDGQLTISGASAATVGTISSTGTGSGASAGTGAIYLTNTGGSTLNFANGSSNGGNYMHGIWNIGGASAGTMNITGGFSEPGGFSTAIPTSGAINGLQFTVGNGGAFTTTTASTLGFQSSQVAGQSSAQTTNSLTVNTGGAVTTAGNFNVLNGTIAQTATTTFNTLMVNGGTFSNSGGILYVGYGNLTNTFLETDTVTVAGGTLNQAGGAVSLGASGTSASNYANILNVSSGAMNVGTAVSTQSLQLGTAHNTAATVSNTVNLSGGKLVVSGTISALAGTGQVNTFNWTGGQLTAGTVTATSVTWTAAGGGGIASSILNNTAGTFAPGDIGTGGLTNTSGLTNASGATFENAGSVSVNGNITNSGTMILTGSATLTVSGTFTNDGMLDVSNWTGTLPAGFVNNGTISNTARPVIFANWQTLSWPGNSDLNTVGPEADPDADGTNNLLEWALGLNPNVSDGFKPTFTPSGAVLEYIYMRGKTAATYQIEWSDNIAGDWSAGGVSSDPPVSLSAFMESVRVTVPADASGRRFIRLKVTKP